MESEWMGRYRPLVAALVRHVNTVTKMTDQYVIELAEGVYTDPVTWQILEYTVENRDNIYKMQDVSDHLGVPQSTFSKKVQLLHRYGYIERYYQEGNRKNIIIRPTQKAVDFYSKCARNNVQDDFMPFFESLEGFTDEEIRHFTESIDLLTDTYMNNHTKPEEVKLVKIEQE